MAERDYRKYCRIKKRMDAVGMGCGDPFRAKYENAREAIYQVCLMLDELKRFRSDSAAGK